MTTTSSSSRLNFSTPPTRWSQTYLFTTREVPNDAEVISHQLMVRAGMIRKLAAGIYTYLPFGWRSLQKLSAIVRREMAAAGAVELSMPSVQPAELWIESGRWQKYGKELLRIRDRHDRDFCFGPKEGCLLRCPGEQLC